MFDVWTLSTVCTWKNYKIKMCGVEEMKLICGKIMGKGLHSGLKKMYMISYKYISYGLYYLILYLKLVLFFSLSLSLDPK